VVTNGGNISLKTVTVINTHYIIVLNKKIGGQVLKS